MSSTAWSKSGLIAAIGAFAMPVIIGIYKFGEIRQAFTDVPIQASFTALLAVASLAIQALAIYKLLKNEPNATALGQKVAALHGIVALVVFVVAAFGAKGTEALWAAWYCGWFGPNPQLDPTPDGPWIGLALLPYLVLAQWACLYLARPVASLREAWRGVAIACISAMALMGLWTFCPSLNEGRWQVFSGAGSTFFNIGVLLHLAALWQVAVRSRFDWAWVALVGFGCLISGPILMRVSWPPSKGSNEFGPDNTDAGFLLEVGWYHLSPYLPLIAYALTAIATVVLFRARRRGSASPSSVTGDA